jgi:hypothetical protein
MLFPFVAWMNSDLFPFVAWMNSDLFPFVAWMNSDEELQTQAQPTC